MSEYRRGRGILISLLVTTALSGSALLISCPPSLPATTCTRDAECPSCYACDTVGGFCYHSGICAGGLCHADTCCTGCWSGEQCLAGDAELACGTGGSACSACEPGTGCTSGRCGPAPASGLALAEELTCALRDDATVWCTGDATASALGSGSTGGATALPQQVLLADVDEPLQGVVSMAGRGNTFCAVDDSGGLWCWGSGYYGQLGQGTTSSAPRAVNVRDASAEPMQGIAQVGVGGTHACAVGIDGRAWCWGNNQYGQLGQGDYATQTFLHATPVLDGAGVPVQGAAQVACGSYISCVRSSSGSVQCTGSNSRGQLGNGTNDNSPALVQVQLAEGGILDGVEEIACGSSHCCARRATGEVRCWGEGNSGQLGDGGGVSRTKAVAVPGLLSAVQLALGSSHSCALLDDGSARCWGSNSSGALGDGSEIDRPLPATVYTLETAAAQGFTFLAAGHSHTCGVLGDGAVWCWGSNDKGQLGLDATAQPTVLAPQPGPGLPPGSCAARPAKAVAASQTHACALLSDGATWCWGSNESGQLGTGLTGTLAWPPQPVVTRLAGTSVAHHEQLASSRADAFSCAIAQDRTAWCWGSNYLGRLGDGGSQGNQAIPVQVTQQSQAVLQPVCSISLGESHACAALDDGAGTVWCWGGDRYQSLGDGPDTSSQPRAVQVLRDASTPLVDVVEVQAGYYHGCARLGSGEVWCWGLGDDGRLATPTSAQEPFARQVELSPGQALADATALAVGNAHACVVRTGDLVWCWGANGSGQLGDGSTTTRTSPVQVAGNLSQVSTLTAGGSHSCALDQNQRAWCWGANVYGQLGDGSTANSSEPVRVRLDPNTMLEPVLSLSAGGEFTCAVDSAGVLRCWGSNAGAQLGQGRSLPFAARPQTVNVGCR
ncbi:MAG: RCC1 repeat-containing protein [Pseudomonadota bacterium]